MMLNVYGYGDSAVKLLSLQLLVQEILALVVHLVLKKMTVN